MKITIPESSGYVTECPVTLDGETRVFPVGVEIDVPEAWAAVINDMLNSQKKTSAKPYVNPEMKSYVDAKDSEQKTYVDAQDAKKVSKSGDTMSGNLNMGNKRVIALQQTPSSVSDATSKKYVDEKTSYSSTEKEIGTWIDGSKMYQKTYSVNPTQNGDYNIDISADLIDKVIDINLIAMIGENAIKGVTFDSEDSYAPFGVGAFRYVTEQLDVIVCTSVLPSAYYALNPTVYVTLKYTKASS